MRSAFPFVASSNVLTSTRRLLFPSSLPEVSETAPSKSSRVITVLTSTTTREGRCSDLLLELLRRMGRAEGRRMGRRSRRRRRGTSSTFPTVRSPSLFSSSVVFDVAKLVFVLL